MRTSEINAQIDQLTEAYLAVGKLPLDDEPKSFTLAAIAETKTRLLTYLQQLRRGEYIEVEPNGSYGYVTCHNDGERDRVYNHDGWRSVAELALSRKQFVVIGEGLERWREHITRRLTQAGVLVIEED